MWLAGGRGDRKRVPKLCPLARGGGGRALGLVVCWGVELGAFGVLASTELVVCPWAMGWGLVVRLVALGPTRGSLVGIVSECFEPAREGVCVNGRG